MTDGMRARLLIVEDQPALRQMLAWELEDLGYTISCAGTCAEGSALHARRTFDCALLDCELPDGTCLELITELKSRAPGLPIIVCSGRGCPDELRQAVSRGAVTFVLKPVSGDQLHRLFKKTLARPRPA